MNELKAKDWPFEINYLGNKASNELAKVLQLSDYFLHASNMETFSIVIAEALSTGTPVLASRVGAISELVTEDCGILSENTIESWLDGLKKLESTNFNYQKISLKTEKYSGKIIGERFQELYKSILKT